MKKLTRKEIATILPQTGFMLLPEEFSTYFDKCSHNDEIIGVGIMNLSEESEWLKHHFGIAPGILFIEFLNQTAALTAISWNNLDGKLPVVLRLQDEPPKFGKEPAIAGETLVAKVRLTKRRKEMFFFEGMVHKEGGPIVLTMGIIGAAVDKEKILPAEIEAA